MLVPPQRKEVAQPACCAAQCSSTNFLLSTTAQWNHIPNAGLLRTYAAKPRARKEGHLPDALYLQ